MRRGWWALGSRCVTSQFLPGTPGTALWSPLSRPETNCSSWVRNVGVRVARGPSGMQGEGLGSHQALPGPSAPSSPPSIGAAYPSAHPTPSSALTLCFAQEVTYWGTERASFAVLCLPDPGLSPGLLWGLTDLESIRTCRLYPAPISQTTPFGPVLLRCGAESVTSPTPGDAPPADGPESWLAGVGMAVTGVASPAEG